MRLMARPKVLLGGPVGPILPGEEKADGSVGAILPGEDKANGLVSAMVSGSVECG